MFLNRRRALPLVGFGAASVILFAAQAAMFRNPQNQPVWGWIAVMFAGLATIMAFSGRRLIVPRPENKFIADAGLTFRWKWCVIALALVVVVTWRSMLSGSFVECMVVWVACMFALARSFGVRLSMPSRLESATLAGLFSIALLLHITDLNNTPYLLDQDEGIFALNGVAIQQAAFQINPFAPGAQSHPNLYQAWIGLSISVLGQTVAAARFPSALIGALGVPALYLLGRELFGRSVGLASALFMLAWPFHVQFSRLALNQPADPLFGTLAFFFLLRGLRGRTHNFALCGICLGLAQLFYLGGRLLPFVMLVYLLWIAWRERTTINKQWRYLFVVPVAALIVTLPQNAYLVQSGQPLTTRSWNNFLLNSRVETQSGESLWEGWDKQVYNSFFALFTVPDQNWYGDSSNLLGLAGGPLLLIGVAVTILSMWRAPKSVLPLGWALAVILGGSTFALFPPQYQRYFPGVSAFALLVGLGAAGIANALSALLPKPPDHASIVVSAGLLLFAFNFAFLVLIYIPERRYFANRPNQVTNLLAQIMQTAANRGQQVVVFANPYPKADSAISKVYLAPEIYFSNGVDNTTVVQYLMGARSYEVVNIPFTSEAAESRLDFHRPFVIIVPLIYANAFNQLTQIEHPGGEPFVIRITEDAQPAFFMYQSTDGLP